MEFLYPASAGARLGDLDPKNIVPNFAFDRKGANIWACSLAACRTVRVADIHWLVNLEGFA
jgi:hypothetical protein